VMGSVLGLLSGDTVLSAPLGQTPAVLSAGEFGEGGNIAHKGALLDTSLGAHFQVDHTEIPEVGGAKVIPGYPQTSYPQATPFSLNWVALLSKLGCLFVETGLPFCRNYTKSNTNLNTKINTTTTHSPRVREAIAANTDLSEARPGRRRVFENPKKLGNVDKVAKPVTTGIDPHPQQIPAGQASPVQPPEQLKSPVLRLPQGLASGWHGPVLKTLEKAPVEIRQMLLDELEGQLNLPNKNIYNPPGWVQALIKKHASGGFVFALAEKVAVERSDRALVEEQVAQVKQGVASPIIAVTVDTPLNGPSPEIRAAMERIRAEHRAKS
jgi:hypothetical protein